MIAIFSRFTPFSCFFTLLFFTPTRPLDSWVTFKAVDSAIQISGGRLLIPPAARGQRGGGAYAMERFWYTIRHPSKLRLPINPEPVYRLPRRDYPNNRAGPTPDLHHSLSRLINGRCSPINDFPFFPPAQPKNWQLIYGRQTHPLTNPLTSPHHLPRLTEVPHGGIQITEQILLPLDRGGLLPICNFSFY